MLVTFIYVCANRLTECEEHLFPSWKQSWCEGLIIQSMSRERCALFCWHTCLYPCSNQLTSHCCLQNSSWLQSQVCPTVKNRTQDIKSVRIITPFQMLSVSDPGFSHLRIFCPRLSPFGQDICHTVLGQMKLNILQASHESQETPGGLYPTITLTYVSKY